MRSDWHRYNLKRRVASLPPISSEIFNEKVLTAQASTNAAAAKASFEKNCSICLKTYFSENAYQNHLGSQKHKLRVAASQKGTNLDTGSMTSSAFSLGDPVNSSTIISPPSPTTPLKDPEAEAEFEKVVGALNDTSLTDKEPIPRRPSRPHHSANEQRKEHPLSPRVDADQIEESHIQSEPLPLSRCLFCNYDSPTFKLSILHMTKHHGLFIPEQNYLTDMEGLLRYFQAKINENHECLYCHKLKNTTGGIQTHMRDKGHCTVAFETEEEMIEVGQFYDFSSTYSDPEDVEDSDTEMDEPKRKAGGGVKLSKDGEEGEDEGWETDSSFSSLDTDDLTSVPIDDRTHSYEKLPMHRHHSHTDARPHRSKDGFHSHGHHHGAHAVFHDDYELHLPNGRTVGHRSLRKYYRQNLHSYPTAAERIEKAQRLLEAGEDDDADMEDVPSSPELRKTQIARRHEGGLLGVTTAQRRHLAGAEKRDRRQGQLEQNRYQAKLEKQNNSQKHFRVSRILFPVLKYIVLMCNTGPSPPVDETMMLGTCGCVGSDN